MVALCRLVVRTPNWEVATKRLLHQQVKFQDHFDLDPCAFCYKRKVKNCSRDKAGANCFPIAISGSVDIPDFP